MAFPRSRSPRSWDFRSARSKRKPSGPSLSAAPGGKNMIKHKGTSKNRRYFSDAAKLPANDSVSFSFRFMDVHSGAARDRYQAQFFEVPISDFDRRIVPLLSDQ